MINCILKYKWIFISFQTQYRASVGIQAYVPSSEGKKDPYAVIGNEWISKPWECSFIVSNLRVILNWVSKGIQGFIGFTLLRSVIGPKTSRHSLYQSEEEIKTTRAFGSLVVFTPSFPWKFSCFTALTPSHKDLGLLSVIFHPFTSWL